MSRAASLHTCPAFSLAEDSVEQWLLTCPALQVRRAQLRQLLQKEHETFEAELHSMGLAFHINRI